jgi:putative pyruvate formate lyase activating enzyme
MKASYLNLYEQGELQERIRRARDLLAPCRLCPRRCGVNRLQTGELGICRTGERGMVASFGPHFGEESPLVGTGGSGTIFFSHCNLLCVFCQNYEISHCPDQEEGVEASPEQLAQVMIDLQEQGCHNINFVTPSHVVPQILEALPHAIESGLWVPLVYNSSGYDSVQTLKLLDGIVDIYMPDFKFWEPDSAKRYMHAPDYPEIARAALKEMHRQVGDLVIDSDGLTSKGLLVRHLVMPSCLEESEQIFHFIARELSPATYVNVMDQYHPCGKAHHFENLNRSLTRAEYETALSMAEKAGLSRLDKKDFSFFLKKLGI